MDELPFDPHKVYQHGLTYTSISHVRTIETLHLIHKLEHQNFKVSKKWLRNQAERKHQHSLPLLPMLHLIICSLNTHSLPLHVEEIIHVKAHILCLQEIR